MARELRNNFLGPEMWGALESAPRTFRFPPFRVRSLPKGKLVMMASKLPSCWNPGMRPGKGAPVS